jgi:hypothetical protein
MQANYTTSDTIMNTGSLKFSTNLIYLFEINKQKNNQKKIDFCRETGITKGAVTKWIYKRVIPNQGNMKRISDYFNKWLELEITIEDLLNTSIDALDQKPNWVFKETEQGYGVKDLNKRIQKELDRISVNGKQTILNLLKDFE